jgi:large exoprotein involved in heme utilization and adhesion
VLVGGGQILVRAGSFRQTGGRLIGFHSDAASDPSPFARAIDISVRDGLSLSGGAFIQAGTGASSDGREIRLEGDVVSFANSTISSVTTADGDGSNIVVEAGSLALDAVSLRTETRATGDAGSIFIDASQVEIDGSSVAVQTLAGSSGTTGSIVVHADSLVLSNFGSLIASTQGSGDAGSISVSAATVEVDGGGDPETGSAIETQALEGSSGAAGRALPDGTLLGVSIDTDALLVSNGARVGTITQSIGPAGDVRLSARDSIRIEGGSNAPSFVRSQAKAATSDSNTIVGASGRIFIDTGRLELARAGKISASTTAGGDAGDIIIRANSVEISGSEGANTSGLSVQTLGGPGIDGGNAGAIRVAVAGDFVLRDGAKVSAETSGNGDAGDIDIVAGGQLILMRGGTITARGTGNARAPSGSIRLEAGRGISLSGRSTVEAESSGRGPAGSIDILAGPWLKLVDSSISTTSARADGGIITIAAADLVSLTDSSVNTSVALSGGEGDGGDIRIDPDLVVVNRSEILANAFDDGDGGSIFIRAGAFVSSSGSVIQASSFGEGSGVDGTIVIESPESDLVAETTQIAQSYLDAAGLMKTACGAQGADLSSLVISRVAGLPATPEGPLPSRLFDQAWLDEDMVVGAKPVRVRVAAIRTACSQMEVIQ